MSGTGRTRFLPVDVAGYVAAGGEEGKPTARYAALWAQRTRPMTTPGWSVASSAAELTKVQEQLKKAGLVPLDPACLAASG